LPIAGKNQRFEEAQKWFHYIFNPTDTSSYSSPRDIGKTATSSKLAVKTISGSKFRTYCAKSLKAIQNLRNKLTSGVLISSSLT
jgi:hypothetical protein